MLTPSMHTFPHVVTVENPGSVLYDEAGGIIEGEPTSFDWPAFVDPAGGGERGVIPNGAAENTYSFSVFMPYTDTIHEQSTLIFEGRPLEIAFIADQGSARSVMIAYCTEVRRP